MAYPLRHYDPETVYFITSRCMQSRFLMCPSAMSNELIGAALARALRQTGVELFAFVFTSNHFHLLVRASEPPRVARFMQALQSDIARKVGRWVKWEGRFFGRRYSAEPLVDEDAQRERLRYILAHGVKEGLVARSSDWPGLTALAMLKDGAAKTFRWRDWSKRWFQHRATGEKVDHFGDDCPTQEERLELTRLPIWRALTPDQVREQVTALEHEVNKEARATVLGADAVMAQDPHSAPEKTDRSSRPKCHASTLELWKAGVEALKQFVAEYRTAAREWAQGVLTVVFPKHCFRPLPPFVRCAGEAFGT